MAEMSALRRPGRIDILMGSIADGVSFQLKMMFNILAVEDDEVDRMNIERAFKRGNLLNPLSFARDGIEALEYLNGGEVREPLLILLDLNMPRMNGLEFLAALRKDRRWSPTPVVVFTTSKEESDRVAAYDKGTNGYIVKPMEFIDFVKTMILLGQYWMVCQFPRGDK